MATDIVQDQVYYGGRVYYAGDTIEVVNTADRNSLRERGVIGDAKMLKAAPENKIIGAAADTKIKART